jgi:acyl carrier protein
LPTPDENNTLQNKTFTGARSETEKTLADLLAPLLGLKEVDVEDNFFTMGGHSLLGTQLITRARDVFQVDLPLRLIFEAPTVAQLSAEIERLLLAKLENMSDEEAEQLLHQTENLAKEV